MHPPSPRIRTRVRTLVGLAALAGAYGLAVSGPAPADESLTFRANRAVPRSCYAALVPGAPGTDRSNLTAPSTGLIRVRLTPTDNGQGDWDVAVFERSTNRVVAAAAGLRGFELAEGLVTNGQQLTVQACRYGGRARTVRAAIAFIPTPTAPSAETTQLVSVATPTREDKQRLQDLDLDLPEAGTDTTVDAVLRGAEDEARLRTAGFRWTVKIANLAEHMRAVRDADARYAASTARSDLPSGRTSYRRLFEIEYELKALAARYPWLVRPFVLNHQTIEGRDVNGIEIALNARQVADGKPIFLNMGVHHAREWPAAEHPVEWAYELIRGFGRDQRTTRLVMATRNIIIPVMNPDGFNISREATARGDFSLFDYEMKRKNCQDKDSPPQYQGGVCANNPAGRLRGTDPNRNYAGWWGGNGASTNWSSDTFRGGAPFSEPETQNIRELVASRQVTNLITNHTYSNLVIRPPGVFATGRPVDEPALRAVGDRMASRNGYRSIHGWQLYDTTGTTEDWTYWITGGLGYTFEIGPNSFHPPFEEGVVNEYLGRGNAAGAGKGGNREAYFDMLQSTADAAQHALVTGWAPPGWTMRAHKEFQSPTSPVRNPDGTVGPPIMFGDVLDSTFKVGGGRFAWHLNPSTRPLVAGRYGRVPTGPPQPPAGLPNPAGQPAENTGDPLAGPHEAIPFTIQDRPYDNGSVTVHVEWTDPDTDWDVYLYNAAGQIVGQAASFGTNFEDAVMLDPLPGQYTAVVVNFDQVDGQPFDDWTGGVQAASPQPAVPGVTEAWVVTCERPNGSIAAVHHAIVGRGQRVDLGDACNLRHAKNRSR